MKEFVFEYYKKNLQAKVLVDYKRQPYVNDLDSILDLHSIRIYHVSIYVIQLVT